MTRELMQGSPANPQGTHLARLGTEPPHPDAAVHGGTVHLAGQVADDLNKNIEGQTHEVLASVDHWLGQTGTDKSRILMCQVFRADIKDFDGMNRVRNAWVPPAPAPPRVAVEAKLARPGWLVEMVVTAAL